MLVTESKPLICMALHRTTTAGLQKKSLIWRVLKYDSRHSQVTRIPEFTNFLLLVVKLHWELEGDQIGNGAADILDLLGLEISCQSLLLHGLLPKSEDDVDAKEDAKHRC